MTIDESIKHCEEVAKEDDDFAKEFYRVSKLETHPDRKRAEDVYVECRKCADEHRQLAEWLKELKAYQEAHEQIRQLPLVWEFGEGVSRCLTIIENCLKEVNTDADSD